MKHSRKTNFNIKKLIPNDNFSLLVSVNIKKILSNALVLKFIEGLENDYLDRVIDIFSGFGFNYEIDDAKIFFATGNDPFEKSVLICHGAFKKRAVLKSVIKELNKADAKIYKDSYMECILYPFLCKGIKMSFTFLADDIFVIASPKWIRKIIDLHIKWSNESINNDDPVRKIINSVNYDAFFWIVFKNSESTYEFLSTHKEFVYYLKNYLYPISSFSFSFSYSDHIDLMTSILSKKGCEFQFAFLVTAITDSLVKYIDSSIPSLTTNQIKKLLFIDTTKEYITIMFKLPVAIFGELVTKFLKIGTPE